MKGCSGSHFKWSEQRAGHSFSGCFHTCQVNLPFTVLASVPRLTGCTLVASISKTLAGGGEPVQKQVWISPESNKWLVVRSVFFCELTGKNLSSVSWIAKKRWTHWGVAERVKGIKTWHLMETRVSFTLETHFGCLYLQSYSFHHCGIQYTLWAARTSTGSLKQRCCSSGLKEASWASD